MQYHWGPKPRWIVKLPEPKLFSEIFGDDAENNQDVRVSLSSAPFVSKLIQVITQFY